jgi:hypothetical protein
VNYYIFKIRGDTYAVPTIYADVYESLSFTFDQDTQRIGLGGKKYPVWYECKALLKKGSTLKHLMVVSYDNSPGIVFIADEVIREKSLQELVNISTAEPDPKGTFFERYITHFIPNPPDSDPNRPKFEGSYLISIPLLFGQ